MPPGGLTPVCYSMCYRWRERGATRQTLQFTRLFQILINTLSIDQQDYSYITETIKSILYIFNATLKLWGHTSVTKVWHPEEKAPFEEKIKYSDTLNCFLFIFCCFFVCFGGIIDIFFLLSRFGHLILFEIKANYHPKSPTENKAERLTRKFCFWGLWMPQSAVGTYYLFHLQQYFPVTQQWRLSHSNILSSN